MHWCDEGKGREEWGVGRGAGKGRSMERKGKEGMIGVRVTEDFHFLIRVRTEGKSYSCKGLAEYVISIEDGSFP